MKTITKIFFRSFLLQALWNFENMQGMGFLYSIMPRLRELYKGDKLKNAVMRHMGFFNTHPYMASFIIGHCAREEGREDLSEKAKETELREYKLRMGGPIAALGDKIFWSTFRPLAGLLGVCWAIMNIRPLYIIPAGILLLYNLPLLFLRCRSLKASYYGKSSISDYLEKIGRSRIVSLLPAAGLLTVAGCLAAAFISWGPVRGYILTLFTVLVIFLRRHFKLSSTTLVYLITAAAVGYNLII